jgi:hypothetical protein
VINNMPDQPFDDDTYAWRLGESHWYFLTDLFLEQLKWAYYYRKFNLPRPLGPRLFADGRVESPTVQDIAST